MFQTETRKVNRNVRRRRLWHRPTKFDNRTKKDTLTPTIQVKVNAKINLLKRLMKIYPISTIVVEDVKFNHYNDYEKKGSSFSNVETGKTKLYNWIKEQNLNLILKFGFETKAKRIEYFKKDLKLKKKSSNSFYAHCIDSFVLAMSGLENFNGKITEKTRFIERNYFNRRKLKQLQNKQGNLKYYKKYVKKGIENSIEEITEYNR